VDQNLSHRILEDRQFMVVRLDPAGNITYVNSCFLKLTGYAETEVLNKNWFGDIQSGDAHEGLKEAFRKTMEEGTTLSDYENTAISKLDDHLLVHWSGVIERDTSGKATGIIAIGEDITEYNQAIKALQNERSQMNVVLSSLNTGLALMNRGMTVEWMNETMMRVLSSGDPIGRKCYSIAGRHSGPCEDCPALLTFEDGQIHARDLLNPVNGCWYRAVAQPVKDTTHYVTKVLESVTDITEQKLAGESLRKSEEKFRGFFTCTPDYCYIISPEGVILDTNDAALDITGYRREELVGRAFTTLYSAESVPKVKQLFESQRWREKGELRGEELVITDRKGGRRIVLLSAGAVRDGEGRDRAFHLDPDGHYRAETHRGSAYRADEGAGGHKKPTRGREHLSEEGDKGRRRVFGHHRKEQWPSLCSHASQGSSAHRFDSPHRGRNGGGERTGCPGNTQHKRSMGETFRNGELRGVAAGACGKRAFRSRARRIYRGAAPSKRPV